ncbi:MAG: ion transporter [Chloroherpetonaceae bacterium]|nr:ion transporter [Chloroherpetonaceae bacterium]
MNTAPQNGTTASLFYQIYHSPLFERTMLVIIIVAGAIVGLETSPTLVAQYGPIFHLLDQLVLAAFTIELVLNFASYGRSPMQFFKDGWNIFNLFVVIACALPYFLPPDAFHTHFFAVLRLARVLRVLKLAEQFEELQLIINALFNSIPSLFYVFLLLVMYFYIYAVLGVDFFQKDCEEFELNTSGAADALSHCNLQ